MRRILILLLPFMATLYAVAQNREAYIKHASGLILAYDAEKDKGVVVAPDNPLARKLLLQQHQDGSYAITFTDDEGGERYLALSGNWNTTFQEDSLTDAARYTIEHARGEYIRLRCKRNGKCLGTDHTNDGSSVYSDKSGTANNHLWFLAETPEQQAQPTAETYLVCPATRLQTNQGWGVSLCWWANMCGKWDEKKIDQIIDWLVSPTGLNYNIFRYNIGGGDDPQNRNCTPHHMGSGKGLRAEMEGFKDSPEDEYHWERDAAQRKIMLKIKEKRPDAIFEAFSNSAPYYMTYSGCVAGNVKGGDDNLRPEFYEEFAHYLVDVCKHYKEEYGIEFRTLEPFNEPNTSYWSAGGGQEGCHFDYASQVAFLRVLAPILAESGLNTMISAADETSVATAVGGFKEYEKAGVLDLVGQWNTHTYTASIPARAQMGSLARTAGKPIWMSEVGAGGSGIGGNLSVMQKMMDDIRYILPTAWIDWQYVEENNDQWCTVRGNFSRQTYERVKNYYVHQHATRFIPAGYTFVPSTHPGTLAAVSPKADTLVLVALNTESVATRHVARLLSAQPDASHLRGYLTTADKNLSTFQPTALAGDTLFYELPPQSIATFIIPTEPIEPQEHEVQPGEHYLVLPQYNVGAALATDAAGGLTLADVNADSTQVWTFEAADGQWLMRNAAGQTVSAGTDYALQTEDNSTSLLNLVPVEDYFWRIMTDDTKAFDLKSEAYSIGTQVGQYAYGNSAAAGHRHWLLLHLPTATPEPSPADAVRDCTTPAQATVIATFDLQGRPMTHSARGLVLQRMSDGSCRKVLRP